MYISVQSRLLKCLIIAWSELMTSGLRTVRQREESAAMWLTSIFLTLEQTNKCLHLSFYFNNFLSFFHLQFGFILKNWERTIISGLFETDK